jgi:hypothetical protein
MGLQVLHSGSEHEYCETIMVYHAIYGQTDDLLH